MGRFRSLVRRAAKPAAMVAVAGALSLSLVVTTPSTAHALVTYPKIPPAATFVMGATKTVAPVAMAAASFSPLGLGLKLAFLAFSTADLWMPLVTGAFGTPQADKESGGATGGYFVLAGFRLGTSSYTSPNRMAYSWTYTGGGSQTKTAVISTSFTCEQTAAGNASHPVGSQFINAATFTQGVSSSLTSGSTAAGRVCPDGSQIIGGTAGPNTNSSVQNGPENILTYGSIGGFNPRGSDVGYQGMSECIDAAGNVSWISGPTTPGDNGAMLMPSCEAAGKGHGTGRTKVIGFKPDGTQETVWDTGANPLTDPATPLCDPGRPGSGCVLEVTKDGQPCTVADVECENWASESKKEGNTRYGCKLGPYTMPLSACNLLERAYFPGGSVLNDPNTDGDPATRSDAGPDGQPAAAPAPTVTGTGTGTAPVPGGSGQTAPGADTKSRQCFPNGWAMFNPVEWVLKPIRCAFEPSKNFAIEGGALRDRAMTKAPLSFVSAIAATAPASVGGAGSCPAWVVNIGTNALGQNSNYSKNVVCDSSFIQAIVNARPVLFGLISGAMLWPFLRSLWYAIIPVVRVIPTGGK